MPRMDLIYGLLISLCGLTSGSAKLAAIAPSFERADSVSSSNLKSNHTMNQVRRSFSDDGWGPWGVWSRCSRTCGGGIAIQERTCFLNKRMEPQSSLKRYTRIGQNRTSRYNIAKKNCTGLKRRYHECNTKACPHGTSDYRAEQCGRYNLKPFRGRFYSWVPYIDANKPCVLNCRPRGQQFYSPLAPSVAEGTRCEVPGYRAICVQGECKVVGRDGILASNTISGGTGPAGGEALYTRCGGRLVSGLYSRPSLPLGYSLITTVPVGACRLNVSELVHSDNYLALKISNGSYIINGNFAISSPGQYDAAGTRFIYKRGGTLSESIWAAGPIDQPVDIMILYQHPNPSIAYAYQIAIPPDEAYPRTTPNAVIAPPLLLPQNSDQTQRHKHRFHQRSRHSGNSPALIVPTLNIVNPQSNRTSLETSRPPNTTNTPQAPLFTTRMLNTEGTKPQYGNSSHIRPQRRRKFVWKVGGFSPCSRTCVGGIQTTMVHCVRDYNHALVPERRCSQPKPKPLTRICGSGPCSPRWQAGSWSSCPRCGPAKRHRIIACVQENNMGMSKVPKDQCSSDLPPESEKCQIPDCTTPTITDTQETKSANADVIADDQRDTKTEHWPKPHRPQDETDNFKDSTTNVIVTRYRNDSLYGDRRRIDDVSNDIGGVDSRGRQSFGGSTSVNNANRIEDNSIGQSNGWKPSGAVWMYSEWSEQCTESCGRGVQTRALLCNDPSGCDGSRRPTTARFCASDRGCSLQPGKWFTGPWSPCSRPCGGSAATMTRELVCVSSVHGAMHVDASGAACSRLARPDNARPCSAASPACPPEWYLSDWSQCTGPCGSSFQSRSVWCAMEDGPHGALPDNLCRDPRPYQKRSCVPPQCAASYQGSNSISDTDGNGNDGSGAKDCSDNFSSCGLAVQARLCQYRYYATSCCLSCQRAGALPSVVT